MMNTQTILVDGQNNEISGFHYNFDCVKLRIGLYEIEGIRIEKNGVRFRSKLRNPSIVGNDPKSSHQKPQKPRNANELPWSKPYTLTSSCMTAQNSGPYAQRVDTKRRAFFHKLIKKNNLHRNKQKPKQDGQHNGTTMSPSQVIV